MLILSGSGGPPRPIATTTSSRCGESSRARWPVTAVFPTRFPVPTTEIDGPSNGSNEGGSSRKSAPTYGTPRASTALASENRSFGPEHGLVGEIDHEVRPEPLDRILELALERHAVVLTSSELLSTTHEHRADDLVRKGGECIADDGRIVLTVDDRESPQVRAVTSSSIAPVNFAYSSVSSENSTSFTRPWNGCCRQIRT